MGSHWEKGELSCETYACCTGIKGPEEGATCSGPADQLYLDVRGGTVQWWLICSLDSHWQGFHYHPRLQPSWDAAHALTRKSSLGLWKKCVRLMSSAGLGSIEILEVVSRLNALVCLWVDSRPFLCDLRLQKALEGNGLVYQLKYPYRYEFFLHLMLASLYPRHGVRRVTPNIRGCFTAHCKTVLKAGHEEQKKQHWKMIDSGYVTMLWLSMPHLSICMVSTCSPDFNTRTSKRGSQFNWISKGPTY